MISLKKLKEKIDMKRPSIIVVPEQTVFRVSVVDGNRNVSCASMVNKDSMQIDIGEGFMTLRFLECINNVQFLSLSFTETPIFVRREYDS